MGKLAVQATPEVGGVVAIGQLVVFHPLIALPASTVQLAAATFVVTLGRQVVVVKPLAEVGELAGAPGAQFCTAPLKVSCEQVVAMYELAELAAIGIQLATGTLTDTTVTRHDASSGAQPETSVIVQVVAVQSLSALAAVVPAMHDPAATGVGLLVSE